MTQLLKDLRQDDSGQGLVEYVLIIALVAVGLVGIITLFRNAMGSLFSTISDTLNSAPTSGFPTT